MPMLRACPTPETGARRFLPTITALLAALALPAGVARADTRTLAATIEAGAPSGAGGTDQPVTVALRGAAAAPVLEEGCTLSEPQWAWSVDDVSVSPPPDAGVDLADIHTVQIDQDGSASPSATLLGFLGQVGTWALTVRATVTYTGSGPGCEGVTWTGTATSAVEASITAETCAVADATAAEAGAAGADAACSAEATQSGAIRIPIPIPLPLCSGIEVAGHSATSLYDCIAREAECAARGQRYDDAVERAKTDWVLSCQRICDRGFGCASGKSCKSVPAPNKTLVTTRRFARCCPDRATRACWVTVIGPCTCECR
jgi:hypothetical protein